MSWPLIENTEHLLYLQVPPQAGPDDREGMLQRVAAFLDQLLGRAAQALRPKADLTGNASSSTSMFYHVTW